MIYLLFVLLLILSMVAFRHDGGHLNSPWFLVNAMFTLCVGTYAFYINLMGKDISFITVFVVIWGLISWGFGQSLAKKRFKGDNKNLLNNKGIYYYDISIKFILFCTVIILITVSYSYKYFMEIGAAFGGHDFFSAYGAARVYMLEIQQGNMAVEIHKPSILTFFEMLGSSLAYYYIYVYFYNKLICHISKPLLLIPIGCYLPILFFATSRMAFFGLGAVAIGIFMTLRYSSSSVTAANRKIFKAVLPIVIIGSIIFRLGGAMRGGAITEEGYTGNQASVSTSITMYVASNIYALNHYLDGEQEFDFGAKTLGGIKQILGRLGVQFKSRPRHYQSVKYKTGAANVFTGFKEDISDYSIYCYWIYIIIIGYICGVFFYKARLLCNEPHGVFFVVLGKLYYPIFIFFYTDDFYGLTGVDFLVPLFLLFLVNRYVKHHFITKNI